MDLFCAVGVGYAYADVRYYPFAAERHTCLLLEKHVLTKVKYAFFEARLRPRLVGFVLLQCNAMFL